MSILERLYDGKVYPCEEILPQNYAEYRAISGQVGNDYEYLLNGKYVLDTLSEKALS